ncbi:MAG: tRNA (adenosine(37)-N6)-dimethylallyltransferase MiaA [Deinococcus sp.]|nr:tRNA (adenosine(37)-N6)-dimethylallyltransferase MiaA [Deinococcus sp.]
MSRQLALVLSGATSSGKSALGVELALASGGEVVSADAMMVYRHMDIGTAKPTVAERSGVPHHLIDVVEPSESYSVGRWVQEAEAALEEIVSRGRTPLVVGGTGFYIRSLCQGTALGPAPDPVVRQRLGQEAAEQGWRALWQRLGAIDPESARRCGPNPRRVMRALEIWEVSGVLPSEQPRRVPVCRFEKVAIERPLAELDRRIEARVEQMLARGLVEEVQAWLELGPGPTAREALGYKEMVRFLQGEMGLGEAVALMKLHSKQYARRQLAWLRSEPGLAWCRPEEVMAWARRLPGS